MIYLKIKLTPTNERIIKDAHMDIIVDVLNSNNKKLERINLRDMFADEDGSIYDEEESKYLMKR